MRRHATVLIVDDEPNVRLVFGTALESVGYRVVEASDGAAALAWLARETCDLVLLDLMMPGMGGLETLRRLREYGQEVPVVIVTARGTVPDAVEAMKLGAIDFVSKPVTAHELRRVVDDVTRRHAGAESPPRPQRQHPETDTVITRLPTVVDLSAAKRALNRREFDLAADLLDEAIAAAPDSAEAQTLKGVLLETQGQHHAAYHAYKAALALNPQYAPARDNLRRYCESQGLDIANPHLNPAAGHR
jgi:DNA-binding response OmpR family regulator